jgi:hypothetical protein
MKNRGICKTGHDLYPIPKTQWILRSQANYAHNVIQKSGLRELKIILGKDCMTVTMNSQMSSLNNMHGTLKTNFVLEFILGNSRVIQFVKY